MDKDEKTNETVAIQMTPSWQLDQLQDVLECSKDRDKRVLLAQSMGSIAAFEALRMGMVSFGVFTSPTFLDPRSELLGSRTVQKRVMLEASGSQGCRVTIRPQSLNYPVYYPEDHFDDSYYWDSPISNQSVMRETTDLMSGCARILVGEKDWNKFTRHYPMFFDTEIVEGEGHAFDWKGDQSAKLVARRLLELVGIAPQKSAM